MEKCRYPSFLWLKLSRFGVVESLSGSTNKVLNTLRAGSDVGSSLVPEQAKEKSYCLARATAAPCSLLMPTHDAFSLHLDLDSVLLKTTRCRIYVFISS